MVRVWRWMVCGCEGDGDGGRSEVGRFIRFVGGVLCWEWLSARVGCLENGLTMIQVSDDTILFIVSVTFFSDTEGASKRENRKR